MRNKCLFSVIIPVYNVEKYIEKCIDSILNQSYKDYEIIIINDGSTDGSENILKKYNNNKKITIITQENQGLSAARNAGIKKAKGDYIVLVDSDDYIEELLLEKLNENINDNIDIIRYQTRTVDDNYNIIKEYNEEEFISLNPNKAIEKILKYHFVENSWLYCYKKQLFTKNKFKYDVGYIHEDFGLTPLLLLNAKKITSINYIGYNYLIRENSIMNNKDIKKTIKKCNDFIELGIRNINIIKKSKFKNKEILLSYIANSILIKGKELDKISRKKYLNTIKENNIDKYLLNNTIKRKIKRILFKINYNLYLKVI